VTLGLSRNAFVRTERFHPPRPGRCPRSGES
jgi:hypothetical protein